jgi:hypothetical protein
MSELPGSGCAESNRPHAGGAPGGVWSRRQFLQESSFGFGAAALSYLLAADGLRAEDPVRQPAPGTSTTLRPSSPHFHAQANAVIVLLQNGGPSQMDLFDPKPELQKRDGQKHSERIESFQPGGESNALMASSFQFAQHGQCGMEFSELLPNIAALADDLCMVRSMYSDNNNHPQALRCLNTGKIFPGRPTLGAWVSYALGTENQNLPAYVVLRDPDGYNSGGTMAWDNGWLPALFRGTEFQSKGAPVLNLQPATPVPADVRRNDLELLAKLNEEHRRLYPGESDLEARIRNYELAARMQLAAGEVLDVSGEPESIQKLYGLDKPQTSDYGKRCLMARRLVESGVRFVLVTAPAGMPWDNHSNLKHDLQQVTGKVDQPVAALIGDLKSRGLLESTIVLWTGEFGRLPISQHGNGRDHNQYAFTVLLAGGGFRGGTTYGATDELGYRSVDRRTSCPDLLATILHQLGLNHEAVGYSHHGRTETLTDAAVTGARVVREILGRPA